MYQVFNKDVVQGLSGYGMLYTHIWILEGQYKINKKNTIRAEAQQMYTKQDEGQWAMGLLEYTVSPNWFFAVFDQFNYNNPKNSKREVHYITGTFGYIRNSTRIALSYGKQREGYLCVGGVCRLMVLGLVVAGSMVFLCSVRFPIASLAAAGFEALGSRSRGFVQCRFRQTQQSTHSNNEFI